MRVIYVAGWMRSGTTLLGEALGTQPGCFNAGEVLGIWNDASRGGRCSCGETLALCPVWGAALEHVQQKFGLPASALGRLADLTLKHFRTRNVVQLRRSVGAAHEFGVGNEISDVVALTRELLAYATRKMQVETLIDTSKLLPGVLFHLAAKSDVHVAHVVRDLRAVAASAARTRDLQAGNAEFLPPGEPPSRTLLHWYGANLSVILGCPWLGVPRIGIRYEAFMSQPQTVLADLCAALAIDFDPSRVSRDEIHVDRSHVAVGNPRRSRGGRVKLHLDDRWRSELGPAMATGLKLASLPGNQLIRTK